MYAHSIAPTDAQMYVAKHVMVSDARNFIDCRTSDQLLNSLTPSFTPRKVVMRERRESGEDTVNEPIILNPNVSDVSSSVTILADADFSDVGDDTEADVFWNQSSPTPNNLLTPDISALPTESG